MNDLVSTMQGAAQQAAAHAAGTLAQTLLARLPRARVVAPSRIHLTPGWLMRGDAERAKQFYRGTFELSGERVELGARSPFEYGGGSRRWQAALRSFTWLADLSESGHALPRAQARALIDEWITLHGRKPDRDWALAVLPARLLSWMRHAPFYLENAGDEFHRRLMTSMGRQVRHLAAHLGRGQHPLDRLNGAIALAFAVNCMDGLEKYRDRAHDHLSRELDQQILPDGGHVSRNPDALVDVLLDLVPLRETYATCNVAPPPSLSIAIDRALPFLATLSHGDGGIAFFNGAGGVRRKAVAEIFARTREARKPMVNARNSGYVRLERDRTLVLMDTGRPALPGRDSAGHAGCLAFELSHATSRIVVNCGHSVDGPPEWRAATRATAAHSTLTIDDRSSARILSHPWLERAVGGPVTIGPARVEAQTEAFESGALATARHDGYSRTFGLIHQRELYLAENGGDVRGEDRLYDAGNRAWKQPVDFAVRFHLHPAVKATLSQDARSVIVMLPNRSGWRFTAKGATVALEESVYFDGRSVPQRTQQIVLNGMVVAKASVKWAFKLMEKAAPRKESTCRTASLPLSGGSMNTAPED